MIGRDSRPASLYHAIVEVVTPPELASLNDFDCVPCDTHASGPANSDGRVTRSVAKVPGGGEGLDIHSQICAFDGA